MRISRFGKTKQRSTAVDRGRHPVGSRKDAFVDILDNQQTPPLPLDVVLEAVDKAAQKLRRQPTFEHLYRYKHLVRDVLRRLITETYGVDEKVSYDRQGRRHLYVMVAAVDQKLEALTSLFLQRQVSSLGLARRLDEIRGLVLDLFT